MKKILVILLVVLLTGCSNELIEYRNVSNTIVSLYNSPKYDKKDLNSLQIKLVDNYLNQLKGLDRIININDYLVYADAYKTTQPNTNGVYIENNTCYINSNDVVLTEYNDRNFEDEAYIVCNGYFTTIKKSNIYYDYDAIINNPKYNYRYLGHTTSDGYQFYYRSYYDGSGLIVSIKNDKIETKFENVDNIQFEKEKPEKKGNYGLYIIIIIIGIITFIIYKKYQQNNNLD